MPLVPYRLLGLSTPDGTGSRCHNAVAGARLVATLLFKNPRFSTLAPLTALLHRKLPFSDPLPILPPQLAYSYAKTLPVWKSFCFASCGGRTCTCDLKVMHFQLRLSPPLNALASGLWAGLYLFPRLRDGGESAV